MPPCEGTNRISSVPVSNMRVHIMETPVGVTCVMFHGETEVGCVHGTLIPISHW